jgi:hypothetical protein
MTKSDVINFINTMLTRPLTALSKLKDVLLYLLDFVSSSTSDALPLWTNTQTFNLDGSGDGIYCKYADTNGKVRLFETKTSGNINHQPPTDPDISENTYWRELSPGAGSSMKQWAASLYGTGDIIVWWIHSVYGIGFYLLVEPVRPFNSPILKRRSLQASGFGFLK